MRITFKQLTFKNFMSRGRNPMVLDLDSGLKILFTGVNGEGKSVNVSALSFALFGKTERDTPKKYIPNFKNMRDCLVTLTFDKNGDSYKIIRGIKPDIFEIHKNDEIMDKEASVKDTQKKLEEIIGLDVFNFFQQTAITATNYTSFPKMKLEDRRKFIEHVFSTYILTDMLKLHKEDIKLLNSERGDILTTKERIGNQYTYERNSLDSYKEDVFFKRDTIYKNIENIKTVKRQELYENNKNEISKIEALLKQELSKDYSKQQEIENMEKIDKLEKDKSRLTESISQISKNLKDMNELNDIREDLVDTVKTLSTTYHDLMAQRDEVASKGKRLKEELKKTLDMENCPTCNEPIKDHDNIVSNLKSELKILSTNWTDLNQQVKVAETNLGKPMDELVLIEQEISRQGELAQSHDRTKHELEMVLSKIINLKSLEFETINPQVAEYRVTIDHLKQVNLEDIINNLIEIENDKLAMLDFGYIDKKQVYVDKIYSELQEWEKRLEENTSALEYGKVISNFLKDDGIKSIVVLKYLPILNQRVNYYLDKLGLFLHFEMDEVFNITFKESYVHELIYNCLSEGQKNRVDIAIMLAFRDIIKIKNFTDFNIFIMDDVFEKVDKSGINDICAIMEEEIQDATLLFINHRQEDYEHVFDEVVVFSRDEHGFTQEKWL